jgi:hypothetical protein
LRDPCQGRRTGLLPDFGRGPAERDPMREGEVAGPQGLEPQLTEPKSAVLPLHHGPPEGAKDGEGSRAGISRQVLNAGGTRDEGPPAAGGREVGRSGSQDVGRSGCRDVRMSGCRDVRMSGCRDVRMSGGREVGWQALLPTANSAAGGGMSGCQDVRRSGCREVGCRDVGMASAPASCQLRRRRPPANCLLPPASCQLRRRRPPASCQLRRRRRGRASQSSPGLTARGVRVASSAESRR